MRRNSSGTGDTIYLPVVAGYVVDDIETSNSFLADFRKTLADLVAFNHYAYFQEYVHRYGLGIQPELAGPHAGPHAGPLDGIQNYGFSDIVMRILVSLAPPFPPRKPLLPRTGLFGSLSWNLSEMDVSSLTFTRISFNFTMKFNCQQG